MNRWVLLEHKVSLNNSVDIHYDFLVEDEIDCLTWKFFKLPSLNKPSVKVIRQPNHRLVWLHRLEHKLSNNRGTVRRIDHGTFIKVSTQSNDKDLLVFLKGSILMLEVMHLSKRCKKLKISDDSSN